MTDTNKQLAEALHYYEQALLTAFPHGAYGQVFESWNRARKALNAYDAEQAAGQELSPGDFICEDHDSPWLICKPCAADGKCASKALNAAKPAGEVQK